MEFTFTQFAAFMSRLEPKFKSGQEYCRTLETVISDALAHFLSPTPGLYELRVESVNVVDFRDMVVYNACIYNDFDPSFENKVVALRLVLPLDGGDSWILRGRIMERGTSDQQFRPYQYDTSVGFEFTREEFIAKYGSTDMNIARYTFDLINEFIKWNNNKQEFSASEPESPGKCDPVVIDPESILESARIIANAPPSKYEKENDLGVYVKCVRRMSQVSEIMQIYPKKMTLEELKQDVEFQLNKYKALVLGKENIDNG